MKFNRTITLLAAAGLLSGAFIAQAAPVPTTTPGPHAAMIIGEPGTRARDLYDVEFIAIDGQNIPSRSTIWLEPGKYELTVRIIAQDTRSTLMRRTRDDEGYNTIEVALEAGKTYEIRAKFNRTDRRSPYTVVVHRVVE